MPATRNTTCRYCGSTALTQFLSLGEQPPSNSFIRPEDVSKEVRYPLDVYHCEACGLVQLLDVVPAEIIFDDYVYLASSSKALKNHYADLARNLTERFGLRAKDSVVDIGCNDGILLHGYELEGLVRVGVEPSKVAEIAAESGLDVVKAFFGKDPAKDIVSKYGQAKVITATNVFAHVDDMASFVEGISVLLDKDGVFVVEASYLLNVIDDTLFDTIYHEHLCYLSLTPMVPFLARFGLEVLDAERVPFGASGPALRVYVQHKGARPQEAHVARMLDEEAQWGIANPARYQGYARQVQQIKADTLKLVDDLKANGVRVGGYGAPAKGNTLLNFMGFDSTAITAIAETNEMKQGLLTPGSHIPIVSEEEFLAQQPDYALLLTWNYLDFFLEKSPYIKAGGRFIVPIPRPRVVP